MFSFLKHRLQHQELKVLEQMPSIKITLAGVCWSIYRVCGLLSYPQKTFL